MLFRKLPQPETTFKNFAMRKVLLTSVLLSGFAISLGGCATTTGGGTASVTLESIKIVCLSRKDTPLTIQQVAENNGALKALGAPKPDCKR